MNLKRLFLSAGLVIPLFSFGAQSSWKELKEISVEYFDLPLEGTAYYRMEFPINQISMDLDGDGAQESIALYIHSSESSDLGMLFTKSLSDSYVSEDIAIDDNVFETRWCEDIGTVSLMLHDFDSDNIPEIILILRGGGDNMGLGVDVAVFRICGSGVDLSKGNVGELRGWLRLAGTFSAFDDDMGWYLNDNLIGIRSSQTGSNYHQLIYMDGRLRKISD